MATSSSQPPLEALDPLDLPGLFSTKGMVALITGGGTGIGFIMARAIATAGAAKVYIVGRRLAVVERAAAAINATLPGAAAAAPVVIPLQCDVASKDSLAAAAARVQADTGYLDVLLVNAGISGPQAPAPADDDPDTSAASLARWRAQQLAVDVAAFQETFLINTIAVWFTAMTFLELLDAGNRRHHTGTSADAARQSSQIIVTSSGAGFNRKAPGGWVYGQSKSAATHAAKQLAVVLPRWGIRVNVIAPGFFLSEMSAPIISKLGGGTGPEPFIPIATASVPVGRVGDTKDMAGTVLYVVSRAGAYLNGNVLLVDGGRLGTFPSMY